MTVEDADASQRRATVAYVFQFFNLLPNLTVLENVGLPLAIAGRRPGSEEARLLDLLERLGLAARAQAPCRTSSRAARCSARRSRARSSGGQPLLLADEPTGNLSQKAGLEVMQILRRAVDEDGRSVLLVTHNPRDACFADRVVFLVDGEIAREPVLRGPGSRSRPCTRRSRGSRSGEAPELTTSMSLVRTIAGKSLLGRPGRTIFSVLGVGLGHRDRGRRVHARPQHGARPLAPGPAGLEARARGAPDRAEVRDPRADLAKTEGVSGVSAMFQNEVERAASGGARRRGDRIRPRPRAHGPGRGPRPGAAVRARSRRRSAASRP